MTSAKEYKRNFEKKSLGWKAKNAVRRAVNPTPAEMREKTAKIKAANLKKEERVKALEESRKARVKAQRLREREAAARRPVTTSRRSSSGRYRDPSTAFDVFANHPLFGGGSSSSQRKGKQKPPKEFDWNLI